MGLSKVDTHKQACHLQHFYNESNIWNQVFRTIYTESTEETIELLRDIGPFNITANAGNRITDEENHAAS